MLEQIDNGYITIPPVICTEADGYKVNYEDQTPEEMEGVGGAEQRQARQHIIDLCGKAV